ncbi:MAG: TlpA family protein disulfide reductase [Flavobacteriales bacterium]|nr:TlpA family protein disulfide reductase [Flavobacteriales bacterium]
MKLLSKTFTFLLLGIIFSAYTPNNGNLAPEIDFNNTEGVDIKLSSLKGNIVLIDFWASWCRPCRRKHPELVGTYNEFKDFKFKQAKHFEIFSVSLDMNKDAWLKAIQQDKLEWINHVSDLKGWRSEVVKTYSIKSLPHNVLLNEQGEIIAQDIYGERLKAFLLKL